MPTFQQRFHQPWRTSKPLADLGGNFDVAIDGRLFKFDRANDAFAQGIQTIAVQAQQQDNSAEPGFGSISREDSWRSGQSSWHHGAGQRYRDKDDSNPERFWASKGVDVWTRDELSLLPDTTKVVNLATTQQELLWCGDYLVYTSGSSFAYSTDGTTFTTLSPGIGTITAITSTGAEIFAVGSTSTFRFKPGTDTTTQSWISGVYDNVAYVRGRLLVSQNRSISEVVGTSLTTLNPSEGNTALRWAALAEGSSAIFAAGNSGDRSTIYKIAVDTDSASAALTVPIPAAPSLPTGEVVTALFGYLGQLAIGTTRGIRTASEDTNGNLTIGSLIELPAVTSLGGNGAFVYFSWNNFDATSTGLGRINLGQLTNTGVFAYASDVMVDGQGVVTAIAPKGDALYLTVAGNGLFKTSGIVNSGWLSSGIIRYGVIDDKVARRIELRHQKLSGQVSVELNVDEQGFVGLGTSSLEGTVTPTSAFTSSIAAGANHEIRLTLTEGATGSPVVQHVELRADVVPTRGLMIFVPVLLGEDALENFNALMALANSKRAVPFQYKAKSWIVTLVDLQYQPQKETRDLSFMDGTMVMKLKAAA